MTCSAFTEALDPCPLECHDGKDTCFLHLSFYEPEQWFNKYIFSPYRDQYYFSSGSKLQAIYSKAILEGRVHIPRDHFRDLDSSDSPESLVDYYLLCCRQPHVDPLWSKKLFTETIKTILSMHMPDFTSILAVNTSLLYRFLDPLFNTKTRSFDYMVCYVLFGCMNQSANKGYIHLDAPISLIQYIKSHPEFIDRILLGHSKHIEALSTMVDLSDAENPIAKFLSSLPDIRKAYKQQCQEKATGLHEALSYAVWKPEMFLDHVSYRELVARWPKFAGKN